MRQAIRGKDGSIGRKRRRGGWSRPIGLVIALLSCLGFAGCSALVDVGASFEEDGGTAGGAAGAPATAGGDGGAAGSSSDAGAGGSGDNGGDECTFGDLSCDGLVPRVCTEAGRWAATRPPCATGCFGGQCIDCESGAKRCKDGAVQSCDAGSWTTEDLCDKVCEAGECKDACTEGWLACNGNLLQVCDGETYSDVEECGFVCQDDGEGNAECAGECATDETRCNPEAPSEAQTCSATGRWGEIKACDDDGRFCVDGVCKACEPGTRRCGESGPQLCSKAGEWVNQGACSEPDPVCVDGNCSRCAPGDRACDGNDLLQCDDDGSGYSLLESCAGDTPSCLEDEQSCGRCEEGDLQCSGNVVQSCTGSGTWENLTACSGSNPECVDGSCKPCAPGARRCEDDNTAQECDDDGSWGSALDCSGDTPICRPDLDAECGCDEGDRRCQSADTPQACEGGAWVTQSACSGTLDHCLDSTGECVDCEPGAEACQNGVAQQCSDDGNWESLNSCAGSMVNCGNCDLGEDCEQDDDCRSGSCSAMKCVECSAGDTDCAGVVPRLCSNSGSWVNQPSCGGDTPVCDPDSAQCICREGDSECLDAQNERRCVGGQWLDRECPLGCAAGADHCTTDTRTVAGQVMCDFENDVACDVTNGDVCQLRYDGVEERECRSGSVGSDSADQFVQCDWHDDCADGKLCCLTQCQASAYCTRCASSCSESPQNGQLCDPDEPDSCPAGRTCGPPLAPNYVKLLADFDFHHCNIP